MRYAEVMSPSFSFPIVISKSESLESQYIAWRWETNIIIKCLQRNNSIGLGIENSRQEVYDITKQCNIKGWDGYDAKPISDMIFGRANTFLSALPIGTEAPSAGPAPNGSIIFEWYRGRGILLSVSIGPDCHFDDCKLRLAKKKHVVQKHFINVIPRSIIELNFPGYW